MRMSESKWDLAKLDAGERSALRRSAGKMVEGAGMDALRAFYKACGYCDPKREAYWFPAMCMDALWRDTDVVKVKSMAECLRAMIAQDASATASMQHRIDMLLETPWDRDGFLLGKMVNQVKLLKSKTDLKPDFQMLADDLRRWNDAGHRVQREWLRILYNAKPITTDEEDANNAD